MRITTGKGFSIDWDTASVEDVLRAVAERHNTFQDGPTACKETASANRHIGMCLEQLERRHADRAARGVRGTNRS